MSTRGQKSPTCHRHPHLWKSPLLLEPTDSSGHTCRVSEGHQAPLPLDFSLISECWQRAAWIHLLHCHSDPRPRALGYSHLPTEPTGYSEKVGIFFKVTVPGCDRAWTAQQQLASGNESKGPSFLLSDGQNTPLVVCLQISVISLYVP